MGIKTKNYGLNMPEQLDFYSVEIQNENMDIIDKALAPDFNDYTDANAIVPPSGTALNGMKKGSKASDLFSNIKAFCLNSLTFDKLTTKPSVTISGQYALDGVEKNPDVEGSLASHLKVLNNNFKYIIADELNGLNKVYTSNSLGCVVVSYSGTSAGAPSSAWGVCICTGSASANSQMAIDGTGKLFYRMFQSGNPSWINNTLNWTQGTYVSSNLNNYTKVGIYIYNGWDGTLLNRPVINKWGTLIVSNTGTTVSQIVVVENGGIYARKYEPSGGWEPWKSNDLNGSMLDWTDQITQTGRYLVTANDTTRRAINNYLPYESDGNIGDLWTIDAISFDGRYIGMIANQLNYGRGGFGSLDTLNRSMNWIKLNNDSNKHDFTTVTDNTDFNNMQTGGWYSIYSEVNSPTVEKNRWLLDVEILSADGTNIVIQTAYFYMGGAYVSKKTRHTYFIINSGWAWSHWY